MEEGLRSCLFLSQRKWSLGMETYYMSTNSHHHLCSPNTAAREMGNVMIWLEFCVERKISSKVFIFFLKKNACPTLPTLTIHLIWGY